jgi:hypothetical protein
MDAFEILSSDAFSTARLSSVINDITFVPGRIGELGLFTPDFVDTTSIVIEKKADLLVIIPKSERGQWGTLVGPEPRRQLHPFKIPHFEINDSVLAESIQNVRTFGSETALETIATKVASRLAIHVNSMAATEEHARMGAIKGVVRYADGSSLDLFSEFMVAPEPTTDFELRQATTDGELRAKCAAISRRVTALLGGVAFTGLHAFCGDDFFDALLGHPEVRENYKGTSQAAILREGYVGPNRSSYGIFEFGGIVFENYRGGNIKGAKDGAVKTFIGADDCHIFPLGVPNLFTSTYAPADYLDTVNTKARRLYAKNYADRAGKNRCIDVQMNALQLCTRPKVLLNGTAGASA